MTHLKRYKIQMYIDNELSDVKRKKTEHHLAECHRCKEYEKQIRAEINTIKKNIQNYNIPEIPELNFNPGEKKQKFKNSYIRIPVPVFSLMVGLILVMGLMLLLRKDKIDTFSDQNNIKKMPVLNYVRLESENSSRILSVDLDLSNYKFIKKPKIRIIREGKNETQSI